jgi:hypothetical protein
MRERRARYPVKKLGLSKEVYNNRPILKALF